MNIGDVLEVKTDKGWVDAVFVKNDISRSIKVFKPLDSKYDGQLIAISDYRYTKYACTKLIKENVYSVKEIPFNQSYKFELAYK